MGTIRRSLVLIAVGAFLVAVTGCSDDELPTKTEFVSQLKDSLGAEVAKTLDQSGIDPKAADKALDAFLGCIYDKIKVDEDMLRKAFDDGGDKAVQAQIEAKATSCASVLRENLTAGSAGG